MTLTALDAAGFLPSGVHDAALDAVRASFGSLRVTERRSRLQQALEILDEDSATP